MEPAIERMAGIAFIVVALSHMLQPQGWSRFFVRLRAMGAPGAFMNAMMSLSLGALIVGFHGTQWSGWPALVTFVGWGQVLKGTVHMCFPVYSLRSMGTVTPDKAWKFILGGAIMLPLGVMMLVTSFRA